MKKKRLMILAMFVTSMLFVFMAPRARSADVETTTRSSGPTVFLLSPQPTTITFSGLDGKPSLELRADGSIYVKGKKVDEDRQVVEGLRALLEGQCYGWPAGKPGKQR